MTEIFLIDLVIFLRIVLSVEDPIDYNNGTELLEKIKKCNLIHFASIPIYKHFYNPLSLD